jgi:hypothetical protein
VPAAVRNHIIISIPTGAGDEAPLSELIKRDRKISFISGVHELFGS